MKYLVSLLAVLFCLSASAVNLIPNSSFETGPNRGWFEWGNSDDAFKGNVSFITGQMTNDAFHGVKSMVVLNGAKLMARAIWLTNGTYVASTYMKSPAGAAGPIYFGLVHGEELASSANPPTNVTVASTWTRYSSTFVAPSNGLYYFKVLHNQPRILVDAVQLEPGTSLTAYAPQSTVELGLTTAGTNNLWFAGDSPTFTLNFWNEGTASNVTARYQIFDLWNSNVVSSNVLVALGAATATTSVIAMPSRTGWFRVMSRIATASDSLDEMTMIVYPYASNITTSATLDWNGGHPHSSDFHLRRELLTGRNWARLLSPNYQPLRWDYIEPTRGNMTFYDFGITNTLARGLNIIAPLTPSDTIWPQWATNGDGTWDQNAWSNYCFRVVDRYKNAKIWWEIGPNEPKQTGPTTPINVQIATNYAKVLQVGIRGVTNADPTANIIAIAGASGNGDWAWEVWTNISAASQAAIDVISTHLYPEDNSADPNIPNDAAGWVNNPYGWITTFGALRPVWNTESGTYGVGSEKSMNATWLSTYNLFYTPPVEAYRSEIENRHTASTVRILTQGLRCIGAGLAKYIYYDSRYFNDSSFSSTLPYGAGYEQVDNAQNASLSIATHFIRKGFGRVVNVNDVAIEMYSYTNASGNPVIAAWNYDRTNRIITATNSGFTVYDCMGNQVQTGLTTAKLTRFPQYFVTTTLTLAQLSNTLTHATEVGTDDVLPPNTSFDIIPTGSWNGDPARQLFKWTSLDDTWTAWRDDPSSTNVLYKWKLDGGSYSAYSQSNHLWVSNLGAGTHTFYVTAKDANQNEAEASFEFVPSVPVTAGSRWDVFGQLTVVNLILGP